MRDGHWLWLSCVSVSSRQLHSSAKEGKPGERDTYESRRRRRHGKLIVKAKGEDAWRFTTSWRIRNTPHGTLIYLSHGTPNE